MPKPAGPPKSELLRGTLFTGFPWGAGGYAHVDGPLASLAPWVGVYGISAAAAWLAYLASLLVQRPVRDSWRYWIAVGASAGLLAACNVQTVAPGSPGTAGAKLTVALEPVRTPTDNVVGVIRAGAAQKLPGVIVVGGLAGVDPDDRPSIALDLSKPGNLVKFYAGGEDAPARVDINGGGGDNHMISGAGVDMIEGVLENTSLASQLEKDGFANPQAAVGEIIRFEDWDRSVKHQRIVGIAPEVRFGSLHAAPEPIALIAPVNAPRSCPNSSLSRRDSVSAPQFNARKGPAARGAARLPQGGRVGRPHCRGR